MVIRKQAALTMNEAKRREYKLYQYTGLGVNMHYGVHNPSWVNMRRAIVERVLMVEGRNGEL